MVSGENTGFYRVEKNIKQRNKEEQVRNVFKADTGLTNKPSLEILTPLQILSPILILNQAPPEEKRMWQRAELVYSSCFRMCVC